MRSVVLAILLLCAAPAERPPELVRGMTISCQTYGPEWGTDGFCEELDRLKQLGVNWVSIHPYGWIRDDGEVRFSFEAGSPPRHFTRPIEEAHARGMHVFVKPHLGYWGSSFRWRGEIDFEEPAQRQRFFETYGHWIETVATITKSADAFAVGTELDRLIEHESEWRGIIARVREKSGAKLTYAANWTDFERVPFWDALDAIGVQAYFPLVAESAPGAHESLDLAALVGGWSEPLTRLRRVHLQTGKPVVFTELGYDLSLTCAVRPWESRPRHSAIPEGADLLQKKCLAASLRVLEREREWLRGAFLWKWFVGSTKREDFLVDTPGMRAVLADAWAVTED